jgi:uncharacterized protein
MSAEKKRIDELPDDILVREALATLERIEGFEKVRFVMLYGSVAKGAARADSDIDLCIYFDGPQDEASLFRFRALAELFDDRYDIQIFLQLPLYVRVDVLSGILLYAPDLEFVYDVAYATIREFDDFKHRLYDYIGEEAMP